MTFSIDNPEGGCNNPPLGKYVREKPSGEQGLTLKEPGFLDPSHSRGGGGADSALPPRSRKPIDETSSVCY